VKLIAGAEATALLAPIRAWRVLGGIGDRVALLPHGQARDLHEVLPIAYAGMSSEDVLHELDQWEWYVLIQQTHRA
jgi:hypothetical protein